MVQAPTVANPAYILGHSDRELNRLIEQGRYFGDLTAQVLELAGLQPGMRVLDVGCGAGDVTFLAASMVGPTGMVIGVDKSPEAIDLATRRAASAGLTNVRFVAEDLSDLSVDEPVDALIGRLVLMYFADPAVVLRGLVAHVKPGGIVAFHEFDLGGAKSDPPCPIFETTLQRLSQTFSRAGIDAQAGLKLGRIFREAGLREPQMILGARVERGSDSSAYEQVAQVMRTLLPVIERTRVATADEVGIETLADRMRDEAVALDATLVSPSFIGAWTRKDAGSPSGS